MPIKNLKEAHEVFDLIGTSTKPVVVHYWPPSHGPESPFTPVLEEASGNRGDKAEFAIVDSGFVHPPHGPHEMPLTVLYKEGQEEKAASFDPSPILQSLDAE